MSATVELEAQTVEVTAAELTAAIAAVLPHVSKDQTLPALCAVRLTAVDGQLTLTATDRYTLAVWRCEPVKDSPLAGSFDFLLDSNDVKALATLAKSVGKYASVIPVTFAVAGDRLTVSTYDSSATYRQADGQFPAVEKLMSNFADSANDMISGKSDCVGYIAVNPDYLARFAKAVEKKDSIRLVFTGRDKAVVVLGVPQFFGVVMPTRVGIDVEIPSWVAGPALAVAS